MSLLCPKCMNQMRQYERNRVVVEQCVECGGLFLDRGELEQLSQAEQSYYGEAPPPPPPAPVRSNDERPYDSRSREDGRRYDDRRYDDRRGDDRRYDDRRGDDRGYDGGYRKSKRKSFLAELFDD